MNCAVAVIIRESGRLLEAWPARMLSDIPGTVRGSRLHEYIRSFNQYRREPVVVVIVPSGVEQW